MSCVLLRTTYDADLHIWMTVSMSPFNIRCGHFQRQQWECYATASWVPYPTHTLRISYDHSPCAEKRLSNPHKISNSITSCDRPPKKHTKKGYPGCLGQVVSGMFHSVVANRRQPNLYTWYSIWGGGGGVHPLSCMAVIVRP